jgi:hypothetical protein
MRAKNRRNSTARERAVSWDSTLPEATSRAAYRLVVPWRTSSWVARCGTPGSTDRIGAVRSNACTWVFSSTHSTKAAWGGFRYSPTTSWTLSMNCGSVESLNVSTRCGLRPTARQIRLMADCDMPRWRARLRVDQTVASAGVVSSVRVSTCSTWVSVEGDHGRRKAPLGPKRGLTQDRRARVVIAGHGFGQTLRRGHDELAVQEPVNRPVAVAFDELALAI